MSHSRLAIYDRSTLCANNSFSRNGAERSIAFFDSDINSYDSEEPLICWNPDNPPFPTPLIYLKQKKS